MHLSRISMINFKNYVQEELEFSSGINCITGNNGVGKTNLLDAIHYLSLTKSYFNPIDSQNIHFGDDFFMVQGDFIVEENIHKLYCGLKRNRKKQFKCDDVEYERLSDHIGLFPVVMVSPNDNVLISGGSDERRKFMDTVISMYNKNYLEDLMRYNRILQQRNRLLKDMAGIPSPDLSLLYIFDDQLMLYGHKIYLERVHFLHELVPVFQHFYNEISSEKESVSIRFESDFQQDDYANMMEKNLHKDRILQHTTHGIHRDDLHFELMDHPIKKTGSQGQQKTYLVALKLAKFEFLTQTKGFNPILLLDDIFDKFDATRVKQIVNLVGKPNFGQIFITDTNSLRLEEVLNKTNSKYALFEVFEDHINKKTIDEKK